jgi:predicted dehydrogenase
LDSKLNVAVIGIGKMGLMHASILNTLPQVNLVALCDKSKFIQKFCRNMFKEKIQVVENLEEFADLNVDVVYITTPIPSHYSIAKSLFENVKTANIFTEKTLTNSYKNSVDINQIAENTGKTNMVGYMKRFSVTFQKAKELLNQNVIGDLTSFEAHAFSSDFFGVETSKMSKGRGGVISDLGSHIIDIALWYFNNFTVEKLANNSINIQNDVSFNVAKDELKGIFNVSWCKEGYHVPEFGLQINGAEGKIIVDDDSVILNKSSQNRQWFRHDLNDNVNFLLGAPEYYRENEHFLLSVQNKTKAKPDFAEASKVDSVIDQVVEQIIEVPTNE